MHKTRRYNNSINIDVKIWVKWKIGRKIKVGERELLYYIIYYIVSSSSRREKRCQKAEGVLEEGRVEGKRGGQIRCGNSFFLAILMKSASHDPYTKTSTNEVRED